MVTALLKRILDGDAPIPKPRTVLLNPVVESKFKRALSAVKVEAVIDDDPRMNFRLVRIRPASFDALKSELKARGVIPNPAIERHIDDVEKDKERYFEFKTKR